MKLPVALRWVLVPVASMASCSATVVGADAVGDGIARLMTPDIGRQIEAVIPTDVRVGLLYGVAAAVWVAAGTWVAPRRRAAVAVLLYVAGACLAWVALRNWYFPEGYPRAYQRSRVPLVLTLIGGLLGTALVMVKQWRTSQNAAGSDAGSTPSPERRAG